ncbi:MAG: initiation control protein YabA [Halanaerobiales bacterium]
MDQEILEELALFQEKIEEISIKFKNLKDITYKLYKENEKLKNENDELKSIIFKEDEEKTPKSKNNLALLHNEGFHICHLSFGEKRKGECLFCLRLIEEDSK